VFGGKRVCIVETGAQRHCRVSMLRHAHCWPRPWASQCSFESDPSLSGGWDQVPSRQPLQTEQFSRWFCCSLSW